MTSSSRPDLPRLLARDVARAAAELAIARFRLATSNPATLVSPGTSPPRPQNGDPAGAAILDRVAWVIPRVAARLPWRADCLVQALAARRWLDRKGIATTLVLGARPGDVTGVHAHAWLRHGERVIIGGEVDDFREFEPAARR